MKPTIKAAIYNPDPSVDRIWARARVLKALQWRFPEAEVRVEYAQDDFYDPCEAVVIALNFGRPALNEAVERLAEHLAESAVAEKEAFR